MVEPTENALPALPPSVVARILSYNVVNFKDVAQLRLLNLVTLLPSLLTSGSVQVKVPSSGDDMELDTSYAMNLVDADGGQYESDRVTVGEIWDTDLTKEVFFFDRAETSKVVFLELSTRRSDQKGSSKKKTSLQGDELMREYKKIVDVMNDTSHLTTAHLKALTNDAKELGFFHAVTAESEGTVVEADNRSLCGPWLLKVDNVIPCNADCIHTRRGNELLLQSRGVPGDDEHPSFFPQLANQIHRALILRETVDTYHICVFIRAICISNNFRDICYDIEFVNREVLVFDQVREAYQKQTMVEGVAIVDGFVSKEFQRDLNIEIDKVCSLQATKDRVDYHPNSNHVVRDIVHPGIFSYVKNGSSLRGNPSDVESATLPTPHISDDSYIDDDENDEQTVDFWGRQYEESVFQWLPTYFTIAKDGQCSIDDYINNLVPREQYMNLYHSLGTLFEEALPYIESVYSYVQAIRPCLREGADDEDFDFAPCVLRPLSLRGQRLQVITKIVDYELQPQQSHSGVWHVEGMSHEEIVLTCLYVLDRDETISGGDLEFKRAYFKDDAGTFLEELDQIRHPRLDAMIQEGMVPLGRVKTLQGRLIVFPNSHVHKVDTMMNELVEGGVAKRRIVVFFLVNPLKRIVSTREVAPQQAYAGGNMSWDDATAHRLRLMEERKYHKQDWNLREVELCEH